MICYLEGEKRDSLHLPSYLVLFLSEGVNKALRDHEIYLAVEKEDTGKGVDCDEAEDEGLYGGLSAFSFASIDFSGIAPDVPLNRCRPFGL